MQAKWTKMILVAGFAAALGVGSAVAQGSGGGAGGAGGAGGSAGSSGMGGSAGGTGMGGTSGTGMSGSSGMQNAPAINDTTGTVRQNNNPASHGGSNAGNLTRGSQACQQVLAHRSQHSQADIQRCQ